MIKSCSILASQCIWSFHCLCANICGYGKFRAQQKILMSDTHTVQCNDLQKCLKQVWISYLGSGKHLGHISSPAWSTTQEEPSAEPTWQRGYSPAPAQRAGSEPAQLSLHDQKYRKCPYCFLFGQKKGWGSGPLTVSLYLLRIKKL